MKFNVYRTGIDEPLDTFEAEDDPAGIMQVLSEGFWWLDGKLEFFDESGEANLEPKDGGWFLFDDDQLIFSLERVL